MQGALEAIPGVDSADVDTATMTATVSTAPGVDPDDLIEALAEVNYTATVK